MDSTAYLTGAVMGTFFGITLGIWIQNGMWYGALGVCIMGAATVCGYIVIRMIPDEKT